MNFARTLNEREGPGVLPPVRLLYEAGVEMSPVLGATHVDYSYYWHQFEGSLRRQVDKVFSRLDMPQDWSVCVGSDLPERPNGLFATGAGLSSCRSSNRDERGVYVAVELSLVG